MKAMIFAAGLGTRLKPLTNDRPKALVEIKGTPILGLQIERMKKFGFDEIIINVHHYSHLIIDYIKANNYFGVRIGISDETDRLLDTGGGLKKAAWFFNDGHPFLVQNVDVITDLNYNDMLESHNLRGGIATLAVRERDTSRYLLFDDHLNLAGWQNVKTKEIIIKRERNNLKPYAFSGIHIIDPDIFSLMPDKEKFSMIDLYLSICSAKNIKAFDHSNGRWFDIGTKEKLEMASNNIPI